MNNKESKYIGGIRVEFGYTEDDLLASIDKYLAEEKPHYIYTINPEFVMKARNDENLRETLNFSDLSVPDGAGILFAKKYLDDVNNMKKGFLLPIKAFLYGIYMGVSCSFDKKKLDNKITGSDVVYKICENAAKKGQTLMLVGGWKKDKQGKMLPDHGNIANKTADKLQKDLPGIKIVYASSDVTLNEKNDDKFLEEVHKELSEQNVKYVDIVLAAFTSGAQEKWLRRLLPKIPGKVGIGVGASFDYIIGEYKRAPKFMKEMNIEWIHRFIFQPWRAKRIFNSVIEFPLFIYMQSIGK